MHSSFRLMLLSTALFCSVTSFLSAAHPAQGLWVGEIELNAVNEATGAVGNSNTFEFTNPATTTATSDVANLRLILHVNGAGQVSLLKSVAVVSGATLSNGTTEILLLTNPSLYPQYPGIAKRFASASFDFGSPSAVNAVQSLIDTATNAAVQKIVTDLGGTASNIESTVMNQLQPVVSGANVNLAYLNRATGSTSFLTTHFFTEADVITLSHRVAELIHQGSKTAANFSFNPAVDLEYQPFPTDPLAANGFTNLVNRAKTLRDSSFYRDTRGLEAIAGILIAAAEATAAMPSNSSLALKQAIAQRAAIYARHNAADLNQAYNQFLASNGFTTMRTLIPDTAVNAAIAAKTANQSQTQIATAVRNALLAQTSVSTAFVAAARIKSESLWQDIRAEDAVDALVDAATNAAAAEVQVTTNAALVKKAVEAAVNTAHAAIPSGAVFLATPTADYNGFVSASSYQSSATTAAKTAASEVVFQFNAGVRDAEQLRFYANRAVTKALASARESAAMIAQNEIRLQGSLLPGGSVSGTLHLPALAPSNPFMHRRHPDHTEGFPITRHLALSVDPTTDGTTNRGGYGVTQITGTYFEEIFGLHKPLGPNKNLGLRTRGTFTLNRVTFVDTLNF